MHTRRSLPTLLMFVSSIGIGALGIGCSGLGTSGSGTTTGSGTGPGGSGGPPPPDFYTACRYTSPAPTPEHGYVLYNYLSDPVQCPAPQASGLVYTVVVFESYANKNNLEVCKDNQIPSGWHIAVDPGPTLTQCPWEPILQPAPTGSQTIIIAKNP